MILEILQSKLFRTIAIMSLTLLFVKIISRIFNKAERNKNIHLKFLKSLLQGLIVVVGIFFIGNQFPAFEKFSSTILASSSLLVVVIGFTLQEGLSTIIHGMMISIFHPFNIGDRIRIEEKNITGIVENITLRHTVVKNITTSAMFKIPNDLMDKAIIENFQVEEIHTNFLDVQIRYEDDVEKAMKIMEEVITSHPLTIDIRTKEQIESGIPQVLVLVRDFAESGIDLRAVSVVTKTINDNFKACSDIRLELLKKFKENNISIPYPHNEILGKLTLEESHS